MGVRDVVFNQDLELWKITTTKGRECLPTRPASVRFVEAEESYEVQIVQHFETFVDAKHYFGLFCPASEAKEDRGGK